MNAQPQHMAALEKANRARLAHAAVKREIREGALTIAAALADPRAATLTIADLLAAQRRWGPRRVGRLLAQQRIAEGRHVESLTVRQRHILAARCSNTPRLAVVEHAAQIPAPRQSARVLAVLLEVGRPLTAVEIRLALKDRMLDVPDLTAILDRLRHTGAVVRRDVCGYELYDLRDAG